VLHLEKNLAQISDTSVIEETVAKVEDHVALQHHPETFMQGAIETEALLKFGYESRVQTLGRVK